MAEVVDLVIKQGSTYRQEFVYKDDDNEIVDLTGYTARMQIRPDVESETIIADLTTENDGITIDGPNGSIELFISHTDTAGMTPTKNAGYDLEIVDSVSGDVNRIFGGKVEIDPEFTR